MSRKLFGKCSTMSKSCTHDIGQIQMSAAGAL